MPNKKKSPHKSSRKSEPKRAKKIDVTAQQYLASCPDSIFGAADWALAALHDAKLVPKTIAFDGQAKGLLGHAICRVLAAKQQQLGIMQVRLQRLEQAALGQFFEALDRNSKQRILERAKQGFAWDDPDE